MSEIIEFKPWAVFEFPWGAAVRHHNGKWEKVVLKNGHEIDVSEMNVILHENGIEFA